jgi:hypothetical protein
VLSKNFELWRNFPILFTKQQPSMHSDDVPSGMLSDDDSSGMSSDDDYSSVKAAKAAGISMLMIAETLFKTVVGDVARPDLAAMPLRDLKRTKGFIFKKKLKLLKKIN